MRLLASCVVAVLLGGVAPLRAADAPELLQTRCGACHRHLDGVRLSRINEQRKTPEGWSMTIARMQHIHNLQVTDDERRALVKYLADTQGLAPEETRGFRYALERRTDVVEAPPDEELAVVCGRCHSYAQVRPAAPRSGGVAEARAFSRRPVADPRVPVSRSRP